VRAEFFGGFLELGHPRFARHFCDDEERLEGVAGPVVDVFEDLQVTIAPKVCPNLRTILLILLN
jgi:hypothetical protein